MHNLRQKDADAGIINVHIKANKKCRFFKLSSQKII